MSNDNNDNVTCSIPTNEGVNSVSCNENPARLRESLVLEFREKWNELLQKFLHSRTEQQQPSEQSPVVRYKEVKQENEEDSNDADHSVTSATDSLSSALSEAVEELHHDLDEADHNIQDLELDFADDLEALARGLETVFDNWREERLVLREAIDLDKSTRSDFHSPKIRDVQQSDKPDDTSDDSSSNDRDGDFARSPRCVQELSDIDVAPTGQEKTCLGPSEDRCSGTSFTWLEQWIELFQQFFCKFKHEKQEQPPSKQETESFLQSVFGQANQNPS